MAGIGFELQRILRRGGIGSFLQVALAGAMITAGPWLLSVGAIALLGRIASRVIQDGERLFIGLVSYSFAFGLLLFGGFHYVFTRVVADLVYEDKKAEAGTALLKAIAFSAAASLVISGAASLLLAPETAGSVWLLRAAAALLFTLVNVNWVLLIFASLLRRFGRIFLVYLAGMAASIGGVSALSPSLGLTGALVGYDLGQLVIVAALAAMSLRAFPPARSAEAHILPGLRKHGYLFLAGCLYYWGIWIDKVVYWIARGEPYPGTFVRTFEPYDIPVFFANLAHIPGMVYFLVIAETQFFLRLKVFLQSLQRGTYRDIQERKYRLLRSALSGLREQSALQGLFTVLLILGGSEIARSILGGVDALLLRLTFAAVFFHLSYLTLLIYLFYFQLYRRASALAALYFTLNLAGSLVSALLAPPSFAALAYLGSGVVATAVGVRIVAVSARSLDRILYASYG